MNLSLSHLRRTAFSGWLAALVVLLAIGSLWVGGWYAVEVALISKEAELERHLDDLGRLAQGQLEEPALNLLDLARDAVWAGRRRGLEADMSVYLETGRTELAKPVDDFASRARLAALVLVDAKGRVLYDTRPGNDLLVPYDYWTIDQQEIKQAWVLAEGASSPAYLARSEPFKRYYVALGESGSRDRVLLCLVAGRDYLADLPRLTQALGRAGVVLTLMLLVLGWIIYRLLRRQRRIELQASEADRLASLGTMAAGFAHELRNPLGIIRAFTEDLERSLRQGEALEDASQSCHEIVEEVDRMNRLVGQFLDYSRGESRPAAGQAASVEAAVRGVVAMLERVAGKRQVALEVQTVGAAQTAPVRVPLEEGAIKQVVMNLALNAVEASAVGQTVTLEVEGESSTVRLSVTDQGDGVRPADRARIFEPFYSRRPTGTGLGLSVCRRIVTQAGGKIEVTDGPQGRGARFVVTLPRVKES